MKRIFIVGIVGAWTTAAGVFVTACGGDDNLKLDSGGMDATVDDTGSNTDGTVGMDSGDMDTGQGMDGGGGMDSGNNNMGPNPGVVNCGTMLDCDAGQNGCCVHFLADAGQTYQCVQFGGCTMGGVRWYCDERADCMQGESCCVFSFQGETQKVCNNFCGNGSARACKSTADCPDAGACNTYTCPGNVVVQACTKPQNCN